MRRRLRLKLPALLLAVLLPFSLLAEKIKLKDGGVVRGNVVSETDTELVIANEYGNITIEKENIASRIKEDSDVPSFKNSTYSWKKRSWPKYAFFGTAALGVGITAFLADEGFALYSGLGFVAVGGTFFALDFFRYGRVPKTTTRKWSSLDMPLTNVIAMSSAGRPGYLETLEEGRPRAGVSFRYQF